MDTDDQLALIEVFLRSPERKYYRLNVTIIINIIYKSQLKPMVFLQNSSVRNIFFKPTFPFYQSYTSFLINIKTQ